MRNGLIMIAAVMCAAMTCSCGSEAVPAAMAAPAAVRTARQMAQGVGDALVQIADEFTTTNSVDWGKPETIAVTRTKYVLIYPTPAAERKKRGPRVIVIRKSDDQIANSNQILQRAGRL